MRFGSRSSRLWIIRDADAARYWNGLKWSSRGIARTYPTKKAAAAVADRIGLGKAAPAKWRLTPPKPKIHPEFYDHSSAVYALVSLPDPDAECDDKGSRLNQRRRSTRFLGEEEGYWVRQIYSLSGVFD